MLATYKKILFLVLCFSYSSAQADSYSHIFPATTGTYNVGTRYYWLVDNNRNDPHEEAPQDLKRTLRIQSWYPMDATSTPGYALYDPNIGISRAFFEAFSSENSMQRSV